jgi:hypothetical protein
MVPSPCSLRASLRLAVHSRRYCGCWSSYYSDTDNKRGAGFGRGADGQSSLLRRPTNRALDCASVVSIDVTLFLLLDLIVRRARPAAHARRLASLRPSKLMTAMASSPTPRPAARPGALGHGTRVVAAPQERAGVPPRGAPAPSALASAQSPAPIEREDGASVRRRVDDAVRSLPVGESPRRRADPVQLPGRPQHATHGACRPTASPACTTMGTPSTWPRRQGPASRAVWFGGERAAPRTRNRHRGAPCHRLRRQGRSRPRARARTRRIFRLVRSGRNVLVRSGTAPPSDPRRRRRRRRPVSACRSLSIPAPSSDSARPGRRGGVDRAAIQGSMKAKEDDA